MSDFNGMREYTVRGGTPPHSVAISAGLGGSTSPEANICTCDHKVWMQGYLCCVEKNLRKEIADQIRALPKRPVVALNHKGWEVADEINGVVLLLAEFVETGKPI